MLNFTKEEETAYLEDVKSAIIKESEAAQKQISDEEITIFETKSYMHDKVYDMDPVEVMQNRQILESMIDSAYNLLTKSKRLKRMSESPYFGRVSFIYDDGEEYGRVKRGVISDGEGRLQAYIGIHAYIKDGKNIIYDWRAPVSSMFYDFEVGRVFFTAPKGRIHGEIDLKRQYKIAGGTLSYMIDSSLKIDDEILQAQLSKATSDKMKNIVATIQREQNSIIRDEESDVLIIQGVAGSGKTSIAMHRIAYILYRLKDKIYSENMMIISPNRVFSDYISNVLPELGEEQILQMTFDDIVDHEILDFCDYRPHYDQIARLLENDDQKLAKRIKFKSTPAFLEEMDAYIAEVEENGFSPADFHYEYDERPFEIPASYIRSRYYAFKRFPVKKRLDFIIEDLTEKLMDYYNIKKSKLKNAYIRNSVYNMQREVDMLKLYRAMYKFMGAEDMLDFDGRVMSYDDVAPFLYLKNALWGADKFLYIKHLVIDEMQDYTPVHYAFFNKLFVCRKTVLGDVNQMVNPYSGAAHDSISRVFERDAKAKVKTLTLNRSYRSTREITEFAAKIAGAPPPEIVERPGEAPEFIKTCDRVSAVLELIGKFTAEGFKSIGILCKTEGSAAALYGELKPRSAESMTLQTAKSERFDNRLLISVPYLAKGLEFDCVIIPDAEKSVYSTAIDRRMLYVAATRALHRLAFVGTGAPPDFLI